jgi:iron complex transport system substrate-binding protein
MELDDITGAIVDESIRIHRDLGPGMLESVYEILLLMRSRFEGFELSGKRAIHLEYDGVVFREGFRVDLLSKVRCWSS